MIIYLQPDQWSGSPKPVESMPEGWAPGVEMTPQARDESEGATERAELAAGKCTNTWRNYPHEYLRGNTNIYRQHRCGREAPHRGACHCRYCGKDRASA